MDRQSWGTCPSGFCSLSEDCSCNHPSVHPWLRLGFSIEHFACRKMFKKNGRYGSDNNDQNGTRVTFREENCYVPHTVRFSPLASLKFWNFCNSYSFGYFPGSHQKEIMGFRFIFSHVHEDFQHNVQSKRIPMTIFILTSLIRVFSLWVKLSVLGSHRTDLCSWAFIISSFTSKYPFFFSKPLCITQWALWFWTKKRSLIICIF